MNPDKPSREQIEARITALLLGELPADEAELLRWTISQDPELQKLHARLLLTAGFVREALAHPADADEKSAPMKLSGERREKLLAHFKTPRPEFVMPVNRGKSFWVKQLQPPSLITVLVVVAIIALLAATMLPALSKAKNKSMRASALNIAKQKALEEQIRAEENSPASAPAPVKPIAGAPSTISQSVGATAVIPPLSPEIVLPKTEPTLEFAGANGSGNFGGGNTGGAGGGGGNSGEARQRGSANNLDTFALKAGAASAPALQSDQNFASLARHDADGVSWGVEDQSRRIGGAIMGPRSGTGGDRNVATADSLDVANSDARTLGLSGGVPLDDLKTPQNLGEVSRGKVHAATTAPAYTFSVENTVASTAPANKKDSDQDFAGYLGAKQADAKPSPDTSDHQIVAQRILQSQPSRLATTTESEQVPVLGDVPVTGTMFQQRLVNIENKATNPTEAYSENVTHNSFDTAAPAAMPASPSTAGGDVMFEFSGKGESTKSDNGTLTLNGNNSFDGGTTINAGKLGGINRVEEPGQTITVFGGLTRDDVSGLRYMLTTNAVALADRDFSPSPTLTQNTLHDLSNDYAEAARNQPYWEAKRELDSRKEFHKLLEAKIAEEKLNLGIPKTSMVTIIDQAQPGESQNTWQRLTGKVESKARIEINQDSADIATMGGTPQSSMMGYDAYFIQTEFQKIQSDKVLGKVVDELKLDEKWSKKNNGEKLSKSEAVALLQKRLDLKTEQNSKLIDIGATSDKPEEAAQIANAVAKAYHDYRLELRNQNTAAGIKALQAESVQQEKQIQIAQANVDRLGKELNAEQSDKPLPKPQPNAPIPQPEVLCRENNFSTFSLNVSDVSFKLAAASLEKGRMPDAASIRSEEFINAFDYRDPEAAAGQPLTFVSERARYPFAHNRDLLRFSVKTAAAGRPDGRALNLVLLLDNSGSMERADRVAIIHEALRVLALQLQPQDTVSVVTFARTPRLWADGVPGDKAGETLKNVGGITPDGGTNLEEAMRLAYETARRHYLANGMNRVVLLTDGAANLGDVSPADLKQKVEAQRKQGIALDCFGIGFEDFNDDLLEQLSSNGDGRYAFLNSPEDASKEFAAKLAGALQVAAQDVKVQVEFNPQRVISWRQIGYAKHQLTKEQFRDNTVDAAEIAAQEAGNALYTVETKPDGIGPISTVRVRYKVPGTTDYRERSWNVDYAAAPALEQSSPAMRLAATASAFSEWLAASPFAQEVTLDELQKILNGVPQVYGADQRPAKLETMIREAKSISGK